MNIMLIIPLSCAFLAFLAGQIGSGLRVKQTLNSVETRHNVLTMRSGFKPKVSHTPSRIPNTGIFSAGFPPMSPIGQHPSPPLVLDQRMGHSHSMRRFRWVRILFAMEGDS